MPTLRDGKTERFYLYAGLQCTVTTDADGSALVTRFSENGTDKLDNVLLGNSGTVTLGEYHGTVIVQVDCLTGSTSFDVTQSTSAATPSGGSNGMDLLVKGSINTSVSYLDFTLPAGYSSYKLQFINLISSTQDYISGSFSSDDGVTFFASYDDAPDYHILTEVGIAPPVNTEVDFDSLFYFVRYIGFVNTYNIEATIFAGSSDYAATVFTSSYNHPDGAHSSYNNVQRTGSRYNGTAALMNAMRVQPYGNGDANPPTSDNTFDSGNYILWGIQS